MTKSAPLRTASAVIALSAASVAFGAGTTEIDPVRARELVRLVRQDCGSCHGLRLKGGLGPALLPEALREKPEESLRVTILMGRPGTAMPPWAPLLTETEVDWILGRLRSGFPEEVKR